MHPVLINGEWRPSQGTHTFQAVNPGTRASLPGDFPISPWGEIEEAIQAASRAFITVRDWPGKRFAEFLDRYATEITAVSEQIVAAAHQETALPVIPRLQDAELPRTINQLRQAAAAAEEGSWKSPVIDTKTDIRSQLGPIGPVAVFGPNNFPCAFNSIAGGDFAAAVAAGNPVLAKGHSSHPETTRLFALAAQTAAQATGMPPGFVQLIYRTKHDDGAKLVSHPLIGASGYTGGRQAGLFLKAAADLGGKPFYAELSSINPVYILPGALEERLPDLITEFAGSSLMGTGQFCTNPGMVVLKQGELTEQFINGIAKKFEQSPAGTLLGAGTESSLRAAIVALQQAGAHVVVGNQPADAGRYCFANTLLRVSAAEFLDNPHALQTEAFGNCALIVVAENDEEIVQLADHLEGNLTGSLYTNTTGSDDRLYARIEPRLRQKVGRLLNDKMPTGVAVSPAMNHGGPFPATCHPGFTAVGIPASLRRFAMLQCYDNVRPARLPLTLQDKNLTGQLWRQIDGVWTRGDVAADPE